MAALWQWQFEYEEYPETWYDPEEYDIHTSKFYPIPVDQLTCYLLKRPKTSEVYLENFHAIRYLEIERDYLSLDAFYLKAGKQPPTDWMERRKAKENFTKSIMNDLLAMEYCTLLNRMPEEYSIDIPYSFRKYWWLREVYRRKIESGAVGYEEDRPHPAFGWRGLLWKMQQHRRKQVIWHTLGEQLKEAKITQEMSLAIKKLSDQVTFKANPSLLLPDNVIRDFRSKRAMLAQDFDLKHEGSRWDTGPVIQEPYTARELWFRAHTPVTRTTTMRKTRRSIADQRASTRPEDWKRIAEERFGVSMDTPPSYMRIGSLPTLGVSLSV